MRVAWILPFVMLVPMAAPAPGPSAASRSDPSTISDRPRVVRIHEDDPGRVAELVRTLDVWEVRRDRGYVVALVEPREHAALARRGVRVEVDAARTERYLSPPGFPCYAGVDALHERMGALAASRPSLAELATIGTSWEGDPIQMLRLTNSGRPGPKPVLFLVAAVHAREMTTSEVALHFAEHLVAGHGSDPDATWLLDHHEVHVVAVANPDGRRLADQGLYQRKNLNDTNGGLCADPPTVSNQYGTDLNRNHSWHWNCCAGSSANPCNQVYHGASPASEPETVALQDQMRAIFPDQRDDQRNAAAPLDATGIMITLHSYGRLVLWPWGDVFPAAPNAADLAVIGAKLASYAGYTPMQSSDLYITDGTTDDWSYGQLGVASFTIEMGDDFFEDCAALPGIQETAREALLYAARVARAPYRLSRGPDVKEAAAAPAGGEAGAPVQVTASASDALHGGQAIASVHYYLDTPPWEGGAAAPMQPADGAFDAPAEAAAAGLDTAGLAPGRHLLFVQAADAAGNAGAVRAALLTIHPPEGVPVTGLEVAPGSQPGGARLSWDPLPGALSYRIAAGSPEGLYDHVYVACGLASTAWEAPPSSPSSYYLVEAVLPGPYAGGFGADSAGARRPAALGSCP